MEYEALYLGAIFQFENRYSQLIAMLFIIMMYSAAIPILYVSGLLICITMYWSDKALFLRHYRLPPRHGRDLASRAIRIMEYAILLHLFVGCYMLSNDTIFSYTSDHENLADYTEEHNETLANYVAKTNWYTTYSSKMVAFIFDTDTSRFSQVHTNLYISGIGVFLILFILERFSIISWLCKRFCFCACLSLEEDTSYSNNIFAELSNSQKKHEFK